MFNHERKKILNEIIQVLQDQEIENTRISQTLACLFDEDSSFLLKQTTCENYLYKLGSWLLTAKETDDENWLEWFIFDNDFGNNRLEVNDKPISTIDELYDLINEQ